MVWHQISMFSFETALFFHTAAVGFEIISCWSAKPTWQSTPCRWLPCYSAGSISCSPSPSPSRDTSPGIVWVRAMCVCRVTITLMKSLLEKSTCVVGVIHSTCFHSFTITTQSVCLVNCGLHSMNTGCLPPCPIFLERFIFYMYHNVALHDLKTYYVVF